jgi:hypothetical protein
LGNKQQQRIFKRFRFLETELAIEKEDMEGEFEIIGM